VKSRRHGATVDQKENHLVTLHTSGGNAEDQMNGTSLRQRPPDDVPDTVEKADLALC